MKRSLTGFAGENIRQIHSLSRRYNGGGKEHSRALLDLVKKHVREIIELHGKSDPRFSVEVGDLIILCHELLLEEKKDPDEIMGLCYGRYESKLKELLEPIS